MTYAEITSPAWRRRRGSAARIRAAAIACAAGLVLALSAGSFALVTAASATDPSDVVLVFDVSNSILLSTDGTNKEFADALDGIATRAQQVATDLAAGNASISFVVFGRQAIAYPANCARLDLHQNPAAIQRFAVCLRSVANEYRAGAKAPVRLKVNTQDTDHVAALVEAEKLLPAASTRSAVIFFTDGENDPPGTARDNEDVVARITPAYAGRSPLAILPVGLGARAGAFESELNRLYTSFIRDMEPCAGRAKFTWPQVVFPSADAAGSAVALALQEVTCSFTVAPTAAPPTPSPVPTPTAAVLAAPTGIRVLGGDHSLTVQWLPPAPGPAEITGYYVNCLPASGGSALEARIETTTELQATFTELVPGAGYRCAVAATSETADGPASPPSEVVVVLGIPGTPSQPRAEPINGGGRLSVDAPAGGAPVEQYDFTCTNADGVAVTGAGSTTTVDVTGLTNGESYQCVAVAGNRIGKSPASVPSAAFTPCANFLDCNPGSRLVIIGAAIIALIGVGAVGARRYRERNRVWITAQVDGGANRPLGWGPELGVHLQQDDAGWFAAAVQPQGATIHVRYQGRNRFMVRQSSRFSDVHQGDPTSVRDDVGASHQLILRRYRDRPAERRVAPPLPAAAAEAAEAAAELGVRLGSSEEA